MYAEMLLLLLECCWECWDAAEGNGAVVGSYPLWHAETASSRLSCTVQALDRLTIIVS